MADEHPTDAVLSHGARYMPRVAEQEIRAALSRRGAVLIEGVRWCGKTTTALHFASSTLRLDDPDSLLVAEADPSEALRGATPRLIDEWQNAPSLWNRIRRECDDRRRPGQFILTGSASAAEDITRHTGTGRIARVTLRPMSLFESGASDGSVSLRDLFQGAAPARQARQDVGLRLVAEWICGGGWPANLDVSPEQARLSARDHLAESVRADVIAANGVRHNREAMTALARSIARNTACEASTSTLAADVAAAAQNGGRHTIANYLAALRRVFLLEDQPAWGLRLRSQSVLRQRPKRHFVDPSLAAAALQATPDRLLKEPSVLGLLFESLAVRDLRVYGQLQRAGAYHYRDKHGLEVGAIVARDDGAWLAVEVKLNHSATTVDKAARSLVRLRDKVSVDRRADLAGLVVLTALGASYLRDDGVQVVSLTHLGP